MRFLEGAWRTLDEVPHGDVSQEHRALWPLAETASHEHSDSAQAAWRHGHASSFIRRCWYPERGCDESSSCSDLRDLWEGARTDVKKLPPPEECGRPMYIVTGTSKVSRNGVMDENRLETLIFPGEKWHKCCLNAGKEGKGPAKLTCEHLREVPRQKLAKEMKGWCGPHKCINPRDRCLIVDEEKEEGFKAKHKGECPLQCKKECTKLTQKFECIYIGIEPPYGQEGSETPQKQFNESEQYDVYALTTTDTSGDQPPQENSEEGKEMATESSMPLAAALLQAPPLAQRATTRRQRWSNFLG